MAIHIPDNEKTLSEIYHEYDIQRVDGGSIIASPKPRGESPIHLADNTKIPIPLDQELGAAGMTKYNRMIYAEYNPKLRGKVGLRKYREMRNDAQVNGMLQVIKTPVLAARWFVEPASMDPKDKYIADFIWNNLNRWMNVSWAEVVQEALYMIDYGYYTFEPVWTTREIDGNELIVLKKLSPRHPLEIHEWMYDDEGGPDGIKYGPQLVEIPIEKLLVFTKNKEAGNMEGVSVLRGGYKHWYFKEQLYKIDAIQKERHGIGIPIIQLPPNFNEKDVAKAHEIGENLRTNEKAHVVVPPNWEISFARLEGNPVDALASAQHHGELLYENIMANYMVSSLSVNSPAVIQQDMFLRGTRYVAEIIRDVFNYFAIPRLVWWNFGIDRVPKLRVRRVGDTTDWRTISFAMRNFAGMKALTPDDMLESWVRDEMDLPNHDPDTARPLDEWDMQDRDHDQDYDTDEDVNRQREAAGSPESESWKPGMPRQTKKADVDVGTKDIGRDASGGK